MMDFVIYTGHPVLSRYWNLGDSTSYGEARNTYGILEVTEKEWQYKINMYLEEVSFGNRSSMQVTQNSVLWWASASVALHLQGLLTKVWSFSLFAD